MKAARLHEYNQDLTLETVPDPSLQGPNDVIVRIAAAGLCRTDLHIMEGIWKNKVNVRLPYILGHENAGYIAEVGPGVTSVKVGDPVIVHPVMTDGICLACRSGEDMHCTNLKFPGIDTDGGFAEYLRTVERSLVRLPEGVKPIDVAPQADAGLTAYRAAKKAAARLSPGNHVVVVGIGGLGHIALQCLRALTGARIIAVDRSQGALDLASKAGADITIQSDGHVVEAVQDATDGGAHAVLDFVGEGDAIQQVLGMLRKGGTYYVIGYGGVLKVPTIDIIFSEISVVGNLVGNYRELVELMVLQAEGKVKLTTCTYAMDQINTAVHDLESGNLHGRGVLIPA
jgi:NAD+-dependent secondary alcohol dehydrogenase Adh1